MADDSLEPSWYVRKPYRHKITGAIKYFSKIDIVFITDYDELAQYELIEETEAMKVLFKENKDK